MVTAQWYRQFAEKEARGSSPTYERLSLAVSLDGELLALLDTLPQRLRQPNTLFAVVRLLGGPVEDPTLFREFVVAQWPAVAAELRSRATQTNEPARCALLLPVLAVLPQPVALIEIGASAGLCLYPDRYTYRIGEHVLGDGALVLDCDMVGIQAPTRLPEVVWRAGVDLNPLDVTDATDMAWLDALIWPEHAERRERLRLAAVYQVRPDRRTAFVDVMRNLDRGHWVAIEAPDVLPYVDLPPLPDHTALNVLALDGRPLAWTRGHGQGLIWFADALPGAL